MTRVVLYANSDMEPITVMDLPDWGMKMLERGEPVYFAPPPKPITTSTLRTEPAPTLDMRTVRIWGEMFMRRGQRHLFLFTDDDEMALLLRADALPGQRGLLTAEYQRGVTDGIVKALRAFGGAL